MNELDDIRRRAGLPITEDSEELDDMIEVLQALKSAYVSLGQIKRDLEEDNLLSRIGSNGDYLNLVVNDNYSIINAALNRYERLVRQARDDDKEDDDRVNENASAGATGAGAISTSVAGRKGKSAFHDLVRRNEEEARKKGKKPKKVDTIFAISQD